MTDILTSEVWVLPDDQTIFDVNDLCTDDNLNDSICLLNSNLAQFGFSNRYVSETMGSAFMFFIYTIVIALLIFLVHLWPGRYPKPISKLSKWLNKKYKWNFFIRQQLEVFFDVIFCCYFNVYYGAITAADVKELTWPEMINFSISLYFVLSCLLLPLILFTFYWLNFEHLEDQEFEEKYGSAYEGLTKHKKSAVIYPTYFTIRRLIFMIAVVFCSDFVLLQLLLCSYSTMFNTCYVFINFPFEKYRDNLLEVFNDLTFLILIEVCRNFTNINLNPDS